jgi:uncharacterized protein YggE
MRTRTALVVSFCLLSIAPFVSRVEGQSSEPTPSIRVSAHATVEASPDQAEVDIGVVTRSARSQPAAAENAGQSNRVFAALRQLLGGDANIRSAAYSIRPVYSQPRATADDSSQMVSGYEVRNVVRVTLNDVMTIDEVIDAATAAGANRVEGVRFLLRDEAKAHAVAVRRAAAAARQR